MIPADIYVPKEANQSSMRMCRVGSLRTWKQGSERRDRCHWEERGHRAPSRSLRAKKKSHILTAGRSLQRAEEALCEGEIARNVVGVTGKEELLERAVSRTCLDEGGDGSLVTKQASYCASKVWCFHLGAPKRP